MNMNDLQPPADQPPAGGGLMSAAATYLSRIDWQQVFVFAARSMAAAAVAYLTFQFARYFQYFGVGALAMSGQFAISLFFLAVILNHTDGLRILTAALGLFLLVNSF
ncbi:hypothetical protein VSS37_09600 [Candidatus Thiothrix sp. Deng01]|uniref:Uncharacterized protein n=1 Tax=Candidatus Thiothrix phosphatis TaxID=3112415 RepID=A0ABU6CWS2_9GAMM|nr:hypothetical protein [Candidatus Thiothrix sp. Deng01]MEB4591230.1 hypothetical protein [Candidatus Thiothrix sp. Deng01]